MRRMCWILAVAVLSMPVAAQVCDTEAVLKAYLEAAKVAEGAYVIAYDHRRGDGWWKGYQWSDEPGSCALRPLGEEVFELRPEGHPRLTLPKDARLHVFVVGTNPYAYTVTAGDGKEVDHEDLAELQQLALLIGSTAAGFVTTSGIEVIPAFRSVVIDSVPSDEDLFTLQGFRVDAEAVARATPPLWIGALSGKLEESSEGLKERIVWVASATKKVQGAIDSLEEAERFLRAVETASLRAGSTRPRVTSETELHAMFEDVKTARGALVELKPLCPTELSLLQKLVELKLLKRTPTPTESAAFDDALEGLARSTSCEPLRQSLDDAALWFEGHPPGSPQTNDDRAVLEGMRKVLIGYRSGFEKSEEIAKLAQTLLDKRGLAGARASLLAHVLSRPPGTAADPCQLTHGVLPVARAEGAGVSVPWSKVRTETFTIAFDDNLKGIVAPTRAKRDEKYELQVASPWRNFDIDLGLVHSNIRQHTYSAVASSTVGGEGDPVVGSGEGDGEESSPPLQIARTQSEKLSGDVTMFVSWLPRKLDRGGISAGPQIGVGLDSDHPAAFAGFLFSLGRYLNLSGGWSWQEVEDLVPGQAIGTVVTSNDDIRTRKEFENGWYASLAITLDDLPFFGGGKEE